MLNTKVPKNNNQQSKSSSISSFLLATIYPSFFGLYLSICHYIRINQYYNIYNLFYFIDIDCYILLIFTIPHLYLWLSIVIYITKSIRITLWSYTSSLLYSNHIILLQYYDYFRISQLIYKAHFVYHDIISGSVGATTWDLKSCSRFRKILSYVYYRSYIFNIILLSSILLEIIINHGIIYYSMYSLFFYPLIASTLRCFHLFGFMDFIKDVSMSDYIYSNFTTPRYPLKFWLYLRNTEYWYGFERKFHPDVVDVLGRTCLLNYARYAHVTKYSRDLTYRVWGLKRLKLQNSSYSRTIITGQPHRWGVRVAAFYWSNHKTRWYHTSRVLYSPLPNIHKATILLVKDNPYSILALLNHPGQNFSLIQRLSKNVVWPKPSVLYKDTEGVILDESKTLIDVIETNFVMSFQSLATNSVIIGTYQAMKNKYGYSNLDAMQMRPDMVSYWFGSLYKYQGYLGIDQKNKNVTNFGRNQAVTGTNEYETIIDDYLKALRNKYNITPEMNQVLDNLINTSNNQEEHIRIWAENLDLFPSKWKPPLKLDKTFDYSNLKPEIVESIKQGELEIRRISDELYIANISEETGSFDDKALDYFEGSIIQDSMK